MRDHPGEIHRLEDLRGIKFVGVFRNVARLSLSLSHVGKTMTQILEPLFDIPHAPVPAFVAPPPPAAPVQVPSVIPIEWLNSWSVVDWLQSIKLSQCAHTLSGPTRLMATDAEQFIANGFDQFVSVKDLTNEDLDLIGVKLPGHKKALVSLFYAYHSLLTPGRSSRTPSFSSRRRRPSWPLGPHQRQHGPRFPLDLVALQRLPRHRAPRPPRQQHNLPQEAAKYCVKSLAPYAVLDTPRGSQTHRPLFPYYRRHL